MPFSTQWSWSTSQDQSLEWLWEEWPLEHESYESCEIETYGLNTLCFMVLSLIAPHVVFHFPSEFHWMIHLFQPLLHSYFFLFEGQKLRSIALQNPAASHLFTWSWIPLAYSPGHVTTPSYCNRLESTGSTRISMCIDSMMGHISHNANILPGHFPTDWGITISGIFCIDSGERELPQDGPFSFHWETTFPLAGLLIEQSEGWVIF